MLLKIYQLGAISLPLATPDIHDFLNYSGSVDSVTPLSDITTMVADNQWVGVKERSVKIESYLLDEVNIEAEAIAQMLTGLISKPIPIIAYMTHDSMYTNIRTCGNCGTDKGCCLTFYTTTGYITGVNLKQKDSYLPPTMTISLKIYDFWYVMNRFFWKWVDYPYTTKVQKQDLTLETNDWCMPTCSQLLSSCLDCHGSFYPMQFNNYDSFYEPSYLAKYGGCSDCNCNNDCCGGKYGMSFGYESPMKKLDVGLSVEYNNAPPNSIFVIKGINSTRDIEFRNNGTEAGMYNRDSVTTIRIASTNSVLTSKGYTALDNNDEIVFGKFVYNNNGKLMRNGMIIKNGVILQDVSPIITFTDYHSGYIIPANDSTISIIGDVDYWSGYVQFGRI